MSRVIAHPNVWTPPFQQQCFRRVLDAVSYPGSVESVGNETPALLATLACLADRMSRVHDRDDLVLESERRLLGAEFTELERAQFVIADGTRPPTPDWVPSQGTLSSPEFGATLLLQCDDLEQGDLAVEIEGPGIPSRKTNRLDGLHPEWIERRQDWVADFPKGVDFILCGRPGLLAWPRTTTIQRC